MNCKQKTLVDLPEFFLDFDFFALTDFDAFDFWKGRSFKHLNENKKRTFALLVARFDFDLSLLTAGFAAREDLSGVFCRVEWIFNLKGVPASCKPALSCPW